MYMSIHSTTELVSMSRKEIRGNEQRSEINSTLQQIGWELLMNNEFSIYCDL